MFLVKTVTIYIGLPTFIGPQLHALFTGYIEFALCSKYIGTLRCNNDDLCTRGKVARRWNLHGRSVYIIYINLKVIYSNISVYIIYINLKVIYSNISKISFIYFIFCYNVRCYLVLIYICIMVYHGALILTCTKNIHFYQATLKEESVAAIITESNHLSPTEVI